MPLPRKCAPQVQPEGPFLPRGCQFRIGEAARLARLYSGVAIFDPRGEPENSSFIPCLPSSGHNVRNGKRPRNGAPCISR